MPDENSKTVTTTTDTKTLIVEQFGRVAVGVVDPLEVVEIEDDQADREPSKRARHSTLCSVILVEVAAVEDAGETVVADQALDIFVVGRLDVATGQVLEQDLADADAVAVGQGVLADLVLVDVSAVGRAKVLDEMSRPVPADARVEAADTVQVELEATPHTSSDVQRLFAEEMTAFFRMMMLGKRMPRK